MLRKIREGKNTRMHIVGCKAMDSSLPPHEVLAAIARGSPMQGQNFDLETGLPVGEPFDVYPTWDQRIQAAIEAAPYFAAKMASIQGYQHFGAVGGSPDEMDASKLSDEEIDARLAAIAKEREAAQRAAGRGGNPPPRAARPKSRAH